MVRALVLVLLVGCWTAPPPEPPLRKQRPRLNVKRGCWTPRFYETFPRELDWTDVYTECRREWEGTMPEQIDACVGTRYKYAYDDWVAWTRRWWEACDPERR